MAAMGLVDLSAGVAPHAQVLVQRMGLRSADDILKLQWNGLEVCATAPPAHPPPPPPAEPRRPSPPLPPPPPPRPPSPRT
jgi:hypothetical protein